MTADFYPAMKRAILSEDVSRKRKKSRSVVHLQFYVYSFSGASLNIKTYSRQFIQCENNKFEMKCGLDIVLSWQTSIYECVAHEG